MANEILVEDRGNISVITLNRPDKLNAMNLDLRNQLIKALRDFNRDPKKRVAVITGSGRAFSVGADISSIAEDLAEDLRNSFYQIIKEVRFSNKIFISAVRGVVAGAGLSLALATDIRFASKDSRFVMAFHNIGLAPDSGLALMMLRLGGVKFEKYILTGGEFNAEIARDLGFEIVDDPLSEALKRAEEISNGPFKSFSASKRLINRVLYQDLEEFLDYEAAMQGALGKTHDFKEGITAFLEKRKPQFKGE
ncbi:enoyl-CoA hydratase-related protein [Sulfurisphaera ohwakuensis]|uniref:Enoyl-CoA hydratase n=1 Tax=Sulfurisphaera ohwakuensis TaxID=69656 RepID=A0A650CJK4_SULOH|nr:enoyl-CoA hydratase-related protein [Sulfurisphaera ohwakuensis]MBB5254655.1 enoyl-CoA hydratase/carnithine racemase [Sulfurisphaera ohwakuensis]QGR18044.1 enoyl-CoA hydratase [Sulfurisphaera ohwakuensis]